MVDQRWRLVLREDPFLAERLLCLSHKVVECCLQENMKFESKASNNSSSVVRAIRSSCPNSYTEKNQGKQCIYNEQGSKQRQGKSLIYSTTPY